MERFATLATILIASSCFAQTAHDYYNEIHAAGGLDRMAALYVCFNEDPNVKNFFVFSENKYLREYMISNGTFDKLSKAQQSELKRDFLIFRGYTKGVPLASNDFLPSVLDRGEFVFPWVLAEVAPTRRPSVLDWVAHAKGTRREPYTGASLTDHCLQTLAECPLGG